MENLCKYNVAGCDRLLSQDGERKIVSPYRLKFFLAIIFGIALHLNLSCDVESLRNRYGKWKPTHRRRLAPLYKNTDPLYDPMINIHLQVPLQ